MEQIKLFDHLFLLFCVYSSFHQGHIYAPDLQKNINLFSNKGDVTYNIYKLNENLKKIVLRC